jgi:hypothetical protein
MCSPDFKPIWEGQIMLSRCLSFFLLSLGVGVVRGWRGGFFFQVVFGVESGLSMSTWIVDSGLSIQVLLGGARFIFLSANGKAQGALLLFLLSLGGEKDFFSFFLVS